MELAEWVRSRRLHFEIEVRGTWRVPPVVALQERADGPALAEYWSSRPEGLQVVATRGMFPRFLGLINVPPLRVLAFARRYGTLHVTRYGLPGAVPWKAEPLFARAPVRWFNYYARLAATALRLAEELRKSRGKQTVGIAADDAITIRAHATWWAARVKAADRRLPDMQIRIPRSRKEHERDAADWPNRFAGFSAPLPETPGKQTEWHVESVADAVADVADWWLATGFVRPSLEFDEGVPAWRDTVEARDLWGAIGLALRAAIVQEPRTAVCEHCGERIPRPPGARAPAISRRHWCPDRDECRRAKGRTHKRDWRGRAITARPPAPAASATARARDVYRPPTR
ncbi:MAG: hypothetical protein WKG32_08330 [Gemmatimonadaceae bacterium]